MDLCTRQGQVVRAVRLADIVRDVREGLDELERRVEDDLKS